MMNYLFVMCILYFCTLPETPPPPKYAHTHSLITHSSLAALVFQLILLKMGYSFLSIAQWHFVDRHIPNRTPFPFFIVSFFSLFFFTA